MSEKKLATIEQLNAAVRKPELTPTQVDEQIASHVEELKAQAVAPVVEEVDPELVRQDQEKLREQRRADNLRRLKAPVLTAGAAEIIVPGRPSFLLTT